MRLPADRLLDMGPGPGQRVGEIVFRRLPDAYWRCLDRDEGFPRQFSDRLAAAGYRAALIPEHYGGSGLDVTEAGIILE